MRGKTQQVQIHHIKAHEGVENIHQRGNDTADKVAKEYMTRGEEMKGTPYFTSYEEEIVLFHEGTLIEGDIRTWLKKHEVETALKNWKALKVSGQLIRRFPKQIPILAKEIWQSAIHSMDGVAWIYFIFAVCHRLPTNLQKHKFLNRRWYVATSAKKATQKTRNISSSVLHSQQHKTISGRPWIMYSGNGTCPTAVLVYQQVLIPKKCGARP
jgi:hypothetical protein